MGRRKRGQEHVRSIQRSKGSYSTSIPIGIIRELKWREGQKIVFKKYGKEGIIIKDWKPKKKSK